eukprot:gnl/TRDRNA2_/TRDRNA2_147727_c2_seq1.p1 gnl/TRDRNA2_/TRDRNA2_147727_c2~~gnl/TRDRNA2_/TRDRNA2_147727_c2_seq1.p1  ORF type:complete len:420 (+),score=99.38 gnl/TRDRNA2_/TRDRNA2_147727_c2_seq1:2-1261(+)
MAAAMAGLLPREVVQTWPVGGSYCHVMSQHLQHIDFQIRLADKDDLPGLLNLEELSREEHLRAPARAILARLEASPTWNLVCTLKERIVAVLYMQRLATVTDLLKTEKIRDAHKFVNPAGQVLQFVDLLFDPRTKGYGSQLRGFALYLARLDPDINTVVAVTRCTDFRRYHDSMEEYVDMHQDGSRVDPGLYLHTSYGASIQRLVPGFWPEDKDNNGIGILIDYKLQILFDESNSKMSVQNAAAKEMPTLQVLKDLMSDWGFIVHEENVTDEFLAFGLNSLEIFRLNARLAATLGMDLSPTLLLDFPTVKGVCDHLDLQRNIGPLAMAKSQQLALLSPAEETDFECRTSPDEIVQMMYAEKKRYAKRKMQEKFAKLSKNSYPEMVTYVLAVDPILFAVQSQILVAFGFLDEDELEFEKV